MTTRKEYERGNIGPEFVRTIIEESVGKTIESISFGPARSDDPECHHDEFLVFRFSDGSELELQGGSNALNLHGNYRDDRGKRLNASDVSLSFVAHFRKSVTVA